MRITDNEKHAALLEKDSLEDLISTLTDPCDGCDTEQPSCPADCGYLEQEGLKIYPRHALKELIRRKFLIAKALSR